MEVLGVSPHCGMCVPRQFQEPRKKKKFLPPSGGPGNSMVEGRAPSAVA